MIKTLFLDIGGVLMTNGWDHAARERAIQYFGLDREEFEIKHKQFYDLHEKDQISLNDYINLTLFWKPQNFTLDEFKAFMYAQSKPFPDMLNFIREIKSKHQLKVALVSNEGRELTLYRVSLANLNALADSFFVSCFVHAQKPDPFIYNLALDVTMAPKEEVLYIDDRANLVEAAARLGIRGIVNNSFESTKQQVLNLLK